MRSFPIKALVVIGLLLLGAACQLADNGLGMFAITCLVSAAIFALQTYRVELKQLSDDTQLTEWLGGRR